MTNVSEQEIATPWLDTGTQVSAQPSAKKTAGLIEKETLKNRISNIE